MKLRCLIEQGKGVTINGTSVDVSKIDWEHKVPVRMNFEGSPIGSASVELEGDKVFAELELEDNIFRNLKDYKFYPAVGLRNCTFVDRKIVSGELMSVGLSATPNADPTIPPIIIEDIL